MEAMDIKSYKPNIMEMKLQRIEVNLQQSIIWTGSEGVCNSICAITHKHRDLLLIRVEYRDLEREIVAICGIKTPTVFYMDSVRVDTWDNVIEKYLEAAYLEEKAMRTMSN